MTAPILKWRDSLGEPHSFEILSDQVLIGRKSDSDIVLPNPYISRHHAKIIRENGGYILADLGSTHGTYLNGRRLEREVLRPGDRIGVGRDQVEITFLSGEQIPDDVANVVEVPEAMQTAFMNLTAMMPLESSGKSELEKVSLLLDFQYQWGDRFSSEGAFHQILTNALEISGAERGFILRRGGKDFEFERGLDAQGNTLEEGDFRTSQSVVKQVAEEGRPVFMTEGISEEFSQQESIVAMNLRAVACLPLQELAGDGESSKVRGILYLDSTKTMHALSGLDQKILDKLASDAGFVLEKIELIRDKQQRLFLEKELELARETQVNLLPQNVPEFSGFRLRAFSRPTRHVGGDFYDFIRLNDGRLTGILADVSGKGVSASLLSSSLQGAMHMQFRSGAEPKAALDELNRFVCERSQANRFVTLFLFTLDSRGRGSFISAGHNPSYLLRAATGEVDELTSEDMILGAFSFATYQAHSVEMAPGDVLVVYSDGLTEAENPEEEMFGERRLVDLIRRNAHLGADGLEEKIFQALDGFTRGHDQTDDITFILAERERL